MSFSTTCLPYFTSYREYLIFCVCNEEESHCNCGTSPKLQFGRIPLESMLERIPSHVYKVGLPFATFLLGGLYGLSYIMEGRIEVI